MSGYTKIEQERILSVALDSIKSFFRSVPFSVPPDWLDNSLFMDLKGTFVTLTRCGKLRGCIGSILPVRPLWKDISENAVHAAFHDPRFDPLEESELQDLEVEVSILTTPNLVECDSFQHLSQNIKPFIDGVILQSGFYKATFLPQVWEEAPNIQQFFKHLCIKAGLPGDFFLTHFQDLKIYLYQVDCFNQKKCSTKNG
jgi:AmmeMemoRadiSam system protein A